MVNIGLVQGERRDRDRGEQCVYAFESGYEIIPIAVGENVYSWGNRTSLRSIA